jgi:hypothetical protein
MRTTLCGTPELFWLQFAFNTAHHETYDCNPFSLMFGFVPNNSLSNIWSISDLLHDKPDTNDLRQLWNRAKRSPGQPTQPKRAHNQPNPYRRQTIHIPPPCHWQTSPAHAESIPYQDPRKPRPTLGNRRPGHTRANPRPGSRCPPQSTTRPTNARPNHAQASPRPR